MCLDMQSFTRIPPRTDVRMPVALRVLGPETCALSLLLSWRMAVPSDSAEGAAWQKHAKAGVGLAVRRKCAQQHKQGGLSFYLAGGWVSCTRL